MRFLLAFLLIVLATPALAQSKAQIIDKLVDDERVTYQKVLEVTNQETLSSLRDQFGPAVLAKMQQTGLTNQLVMNDADLQNLMQGIKGVYDRTFNEKELQVMYACSSNPDYAPVKAKLPTLAVETQRFIAQATQAKMTSIMPLIQKFAVENADLFQKQ